MTTKCCTKLEVAQKRCPIVFSCDQAALRTLISVCLSVRLSVRLSNLFDNVLLIVATWNFQELIPFTEVMSMQKVKVRGQRSRSQRSQPHLAVFRTLTPFEFTYGDEMLHKAWCCLKEVPCYFSRSSVKFQGLKANKIANIDPNWVVPNCNSSLKSQKSLKWCRKL